MKQFLRLPDAFEVIDTLKLSALLVMGILPTASIISFIDCLYIRAGVPFAW